METNANEHIHQGGNVKRFREMIGLKQEALANIMGSDWTQRKISLLEQKETIDPKTLKEVAKALNVTPEAIKTFNEETASTFINTFNDNSSIVGVNGLSYTFNPIDKLVEVFEDSKILYERLLQAEKEKVELVIKTNQDLQKLIQRLHNKE